VMLAGDRPKNVPDRVSDRVGWLAILTRRGRRRDVFGAVAAYHRSDLLELLEE
jgi:hypothetical protein